MNTTIPYESLETISKKFSILLVSDNIANIHPELTQKFDKVFVTTNENEIIELIKEENTVVNFVFLDAETVGLNWLSLIHTIRKYKYDMPIALIMKLDEPDRLTTAIAIGITQCLFHPITPSRLRFVIVDMVNKLKNKLDAKELFYKKQEERLLDIANASARKIIQDIPFPMFVFKESEVLFANKSLYNLFIHKKINIQKKISLHDIEKLFDNINENIYFSSISVGKSLDVKYHYKDTTLKKVFIPTKFFIQLNIDHDDYTVIILNDIASHLMQIKMMTYQKQKVDSYKEVIEELLARRIFKESAKAVTKSLAIENTKNNTFDKGLSDKEVALLRKSNQLKISAQEYIEHLDDSSYEEINELNAIESDIQGAIDIFIRHARKASIVEVARLFEVYGTTIKSLIEFVDLGNAICSLSDFIRSLDDEEIIKNTIAIHMLFENLYEDLVQWRTNIFSTKVAVDIHYLDSSIFSSVLQLQLNISNDNDLSDDFELF